MIDQGYFGGMRIGIGVDPRTDIPPSRVGFVYFVLVDPGGPSDAYVIDTRILYRPGMFLIVPSLPTGATPVMKVYVDWNFGGLAWVSNGF